LGIKCSTEDVGKGRFEVVVNEKVVWSKREEGRFPHEGEIVRLLRKLFR